MTFLMRKLRSVLDYKSLIGEKAHREQKISSEVAWISAASSSR